MNLRLSSTGLPLLLSLTLTLTAPTTQLAAAAAQSHKHRGGGGGGGGVFLSTPNPTNPLEHNNRGVELGQKGLWPQAIQEAELALEGDPDNDVFMRNLSGAHLRFGDSLANKKNIPSAIVQYREALYVDPANVAAENGLNACLGHMGKSPSNLSYRQSLASGALGHGEYKVAVVEYRVCCHIQDSGINNYHLGQALFKAGKVVEGYDQLRTALRKDWPRDDQDALVECHLQLADILLEFAYTAKKQPNRQADYLKRLNNSMVEYRRAVTINPSNMAAVHGLTETCREAVAAAPTFGNFMALGAAYLLQGDFDHAKIMYEKAWRANPKSPDLARARMAFHRAVVEAPQGLVAPMRIAESVQKVEDLLKNNPNDADLLYILGTGKARIGDTAGAMDALQRSLRARPYDEITQHRLDLIRGGGITPSVPGTAPGAVAVVPGAPGAQPGMPIIPGVTPGAPGAPGAIVGAPPGAPGAVPGAPGQPAGPNPALVNIANLIRGNQFDPAAKACDDVLNATPAEGQAWFMKGMIMEKKGDLDEAAVCYRQASGLKVKEADDALNKINSQRTKPLIDQADTLNSKGDTAGAAELLKEATNMSPHDPALWHKLADMQKKAGDDKGAERSLKKADDAAKGK